MKSPHPDDLSRMADAWSHALQTGDPYEVEHRIRTASGEYRWMCTTAFPRRDEAGAIVKWYGNTEDIDRRKRAESSLILNEKLIAVGRLAASIAHEINNPLETVTNLLYMMRTSAELPAEVKGYLDTAEREILRAAVISRQALRSQKHSTTPTTVTYQDLFDGVLSIYQGRLSSSGIEVTTRLCSTAIHCFEGEIRPVLNNLISNAIDAMQPGGGRLFLRGTEGTNWKTRQKGLFITVADSGQGISPRF